jgi:hypothetical protein
MAIPGMITDFSRQQANYGMAVGQSLQQLGQQVGQQLANQEYQRQAAAQLPFITQQMQEAAKEASTGRFGDAYSKVLGLTANPQVMQNPFILPALEMGMQAIKQGSSQAWFNLQQEQMQGRRGGTTRPIGFRVPSAEELSDPNANIESDVVYAEDGIPGMGGRTSFGSSVLQGTEAQRRDQAAADAEYGAPVDPDVQAGRDLMAMQPDGQGESISFGFGTISQYKPKPEVQKSTQEEIKRYESLSQEDKADYKTQITETDTGYQVPQGRKAEPFQGIIGFEDAVFIEGPVAGGQKVTGIKEKYSQRTGKEVERTLAPADDSDEKTFNGFIKSLQEASRFAMRNPQLRKIIEATGGDLTRIDFQDDKDPETGEMVIKAYVEGVDMGVLSTDKDFDERLALKILADAPAAIRDNGWKVIKGERPAAAAEEEGAPQTTADKVRAKFGKTEQPAPAPKPAPSAAPTAPEFSSENPFAEEAQAAQAAPAGKPRQAERTRGIQSRKITASKKLETVTEQIKNINSMKVGRRNATPTEKARRWEELNAEKKRLEGILAQ